MRIISGKRRGLKLTPPMGENTRPTTDRVKESLFNIIQTHLPCDTVLDLFAGSGALGIEALSRGAKRAVFCERDAMTKKLVEKNIGDAGMTEDACVMQVDSLEFLEQLGNNLSNTTTFDIIFLDPPYNKGLLSTALDKIYDYNILNDDGIIVAETEYGGEAPDEKKFKVKKTAKYGKTVITVLQKVVI